jgi:hypothetical protein
MFEINYVFALAAGLDNLTTRMFNNHLLTLANVLHGRVDHTPEWITRFY